MSALAREIVASRRVTGPDGRIHPLTAETNIEQCEFLAGLITGIDARVCVEIGLAFGISALFTCDAIAGKSGAKFISIDPGWLDDIGRFNLDKAGFGSLCEFHRDYSHGVLPRLLDSGLRIDFAYVDSTKVFDALLIDAYYLSRLLRVGGVLVLDDCRAWPGPKRLARYLARWPHLQIHGKFGPYSVGAGRKLANALSVAMPFAQRLFADDVLMPEDALGVNASCVAFRKTAEDARDWKWHAAL